mgnify:CR=1 FL=1
MLQIMTDLISKLLDVGLFQFGAFTVNGVVQPFVHHLEMLPAYPILLSAVGSTIATHLKDRSSSHVLCAPDAISLGTVVSLELSKSLVFPNADGTVLIGAHDIGHPTVLVINQWRGDAPMLQLIRTAHRTGLQVEYIVSVVDGVAVALPEGVQAAFELIHVAQVVEVAETTQRIPAGQANAVRRWITQ